MKKYIIFSFVALAGLVLSGCDEDYDDWASAQAYDQETSSSAYSVLGAVSSSSIIMENLSDELVTLFSVATIDEISSYTISSLTVNGESLSGAYIEDGVVVVDAAELAKLVEVYYDSRAAETRTLEVKISLSLALPNGDSVLDVYSSTFSFTDYDVPEASADGYYMLGDWQGWSLTDPTVMELQADGTYMATITTTSSGDNWFKFYRADTWSDSDWDVVNAGQIGCETNGDASTHNIAVYQGDPLYDGVQTPVISGASLFEVVFDPANLTYTVTRAEQMYYPTGSFNSWNGSEKNTILFPQGSNVYRLATYYTASWDFKFWDEDGFGDWDIMYGCISSEDNAGGNGGTIDYGESIGCITPGAAGYSICVIDMTAMTYAWETIEDTPAEYTYISFTGVDGDWSTFIDLEQVYTNSADEDSNAIGSHNWYATATISSDSEVKFLADHAWDVNWGVAVNISENCYGTGEQNGSNITVPAGTYRIYFNDITGDFVFVDASDD